MSSSPLFADGVGQLFDLLEKIVANFALGLRFVVFQTRRSFCEWWPRRGKFRGQTRVALRTLVTLGIQAHFQSREFLVDERLQRFQVAARGLAQIRRFLLQGFFQAREALLVVAHVGAEENVANLVDVARLGGTCAAGRFEPGNRRCEDGPAGGSDLLRAGVRRELRSWNSSSILSLQILYENHFVALGAVDQLVGETLCHQQSESAGPDAHFACAIPTCRNGSSGELAMAAWASVSMEKPSPGSRM